MGFFAKHDITDIWADEEDAVFLLRAPKRRADFVVRYKDFMAAMDTVMPRPEALEYQDDAAQLGKIKKRAANRFRDESLAHVDAGAKVRELIDEHLIADGIDPKIPPVSLLDADFAEHVRAQSSDRAKASEMEHAARHHIQKHRDEDPAFYDRLSERLEQIMAEYEENWKTQRQLFEDLIHDVREGRKAEDTGLNTKLNTRKEAPFFSLLEQLVAEAQDGVVAEKPASYSSGSEALSDETREHLADVTVDMVDHISQEVSNVDFWRNSAAQNQLRSWIFTHLDHEQVLPFGKLDSAADKLMDLARHRHSHLIS